MATPAKLPASAAKPPAWVTATHAQRQAALKPVATAKDRLLPGQALGKGGRITSPNGAYYFTLQTDGNLVLYNAANKPVWYPSQASIPPYILGNLAGKGGVRLSMQPDGNLVVYNGQNAPLWSTQTNGRGPAFLVIQNDGNLVLYKPGSTQSIWQSYTSGGTYHPERYSSNAFKSIAGTLGGAAKGLASGVSVAAKFSGKVFTDATKSPLWKIAAAAAPFVLPGVGLAVSAGMVTAAAIGKAGSVKDAIIGAVRANLPNDAMKSGFDAGTGVAINGEGMDEAALKFVRGQLPPGPALQGFDTALALHAGRVTAGPAPAGLSATAQGAFYTAHGAINVGAPPAMKKAVAEATASHPEGRKGLQAALGVGGNVTWLEWLWTEMKHLGVQVHASLLGPTPKNVITTQGESVP